MGQEPRNDLSIEEPDISILTFETVPNLDSTFAGQAISTDDFSSRPAPRSESATTLPKGRILWVAQTARTFIGFLILVSAFLAYLCWNSEQVERSDKPYPPRAAAAQTVPKVMAEAMSCSLGLEKTGRRVSVSAPLVPGERFKLHFITRQPGHLYIIAPDRNNVPRLLLTTQPNPDWGVKTNRIEANADYSFPPRSEKWLRITGDVNAETYLIIFAPAPLNDPDFLNGPAGRKLTASEMEAMRQRFNKEARIEPSGDHAAVKVSTPSTGEPFAFDIKVEINHSSKWNGL